ncbi:protein PELOTA 1 [Tanacetum coccineum]
MVKVPAVHGAYTNTNYSKVFDIVAFFLCLVFSFIHSEALLGARKVLREAALRSGKAERRNLKLEINVEYDKKGSVLRIGGKNILENEHVKIGKFHTLELELHHPFVLRKLLWDSQAVKLLQQAADPSASADLAVLLMHEGLAHILLVYNISICLNEFSVKLDHPYTITCSRIKASISRKHGPSVDGYDEALNKFYENVLQAFIHHIDFKVVRCAVIASPGFTKDQFHRRLMSEAEKRDLRNIIENKSHIILVPSNSGYIHSLIEVLNAPTVMNLIKDTKAAQEVGALKEFFSMLPKDRACYGPKHVEVANERMAVQTLLITDELFRSADIASRQRYVNLVKSIEKNGGTTRLMYFLQSMFRGNNGPHPAIYGTCLAYLPIPLPDLEDISESDVTTVRITDSPLLYE